MKDHGETLVPCEARTDMWQLPRLPLPPGWRHCGSATRGWMCNGGSSSKEGHGGWKEGGWKAREAAGLVALRAGG